MAEGFELVRIVRHHLRRSAALLDDGRFTEALAEVESALALDPQSLPVQTLRDRIVAARTAAQAPVARTDPRGARHGTVTHGEGGEGKVSRSFVPYGVSAASWRGFEQRVTERRFKALVESIEVSIAAGDAPAARDALEEAHELRPGAAELAELDARVSAVPVSPPAVETPPASRIWLRAMGAAALFLVGVSLLLGLEWLRPGEPPAPLPAVSPDVPARAPVPEARPAVAPDLAPVPVAMNDEESVPAIVTPPEPLLRPRATTGAPPAPTARPVATPAASPAARAAATRAAAPPPVAETIERAIEDEEPAPSREVPDDYVAPPRNVSALRSDPEPAVAPTGVADMAVTADVRDSPMPPAALASAVLRPAAEQGRVEEVLRRYARAYEALDARAARAVWPTVDERALARAFQNLASQNVSFEGCDIDIRGAIANASCRGQASYVGKVGSREPRTEARTWRFELRRDGDAWKIENAEARREAAPETRHQ